MLAARLPRPRIRVLRRALATAGTASPVDATSSQPTRKKPKLAVAPTSGAELAPLLNAELADKHRTRCFNCGAFDHVAAACARLRRCYNCGGEGHLTRTCPEPRNWRKVCYICGSEAHGFFECPDSLSRVGHDEPAG